MKQPPLPKPTADMNFATVDHINHLGAHSFEVFTPGSGVEVRDIGFGKFSDGKVGVMVMRAVGSHPPEGKVWHMHNLTFQIGYTIKGWMLYEIEGVGEVRAEAGTAIYHLPRNRLRILDRSDDFEGVYFESPTTDTLTVFAFDEEAKSYQEMSFERSLS